MVASVRWRRPSERRSQAPYESASAGGTRAGPALAPSGGIRRSEDGERAAHGRTVPGGRAAPARDPAAPGDARDAGVHEHPGRADRAERAPAALVRLSARARDPRPRPLLDEGHLRDRRAAGGREEWVGWRIRRA